MKCCETTSVDGKCADFWPFTCGPAKMSQKFYDAQLQLFGTAVTETNDGNLLC